ncbi:MAG: hypothetical protein A2845_06110 [Candidatus Lloydbacteria bacterium RIFCSPHIGHO2_01_FULL_49_22]|uniref:Uncharacterized protein n=1 Tax=Candidatus Lloydbacteria bacterium RIFCSPHIGHO2_01_FULL_49_22 TaxID=1798658 RepID=A0A1G2CYK5_9BACT|nr:MAG: hypothetical protein A2845_06110 [Candidatus Lloydbacteria bacterium RIFCSPHIGHO2_01_FULL_49_22]OGZ08817.1 MAG: hypothetical protein A3C14_01120 [Candidatus Lloydbacteria bacterium RIFCSPHIGHO2_02_FULL_50_18]
MDSSDNIIDMRLPFATSGFAAMHHKEMRAYAGIPQCKTERDFLAHHKAETLSDLTTPQKAELEACMRRMFDALQLHANYLLEQLGASSESSLSPADRFVYDASMKATIAFEDHYP